MSKGQPPTVIPLVKQEEGDDPLAWANDSAFAMESVSVIAAGTAAAGGGDDDYEVGSNIGEESGVDETGQEAEAPTPKETSRKKAVVKCFVSSCLQKHRAAANASFHKWPKNDPETKDAWVLACGRQNVKLNDHQGICGLHFAESAFLGSDGWRKEMNLEPKKRILKEGALPTLNLASKIEDYVIRFMKRVTVKTGPSKEEVPTNKMRIEVGPPYEHLMKTIKDPQLINITANVVVARPPKAKRQKGPKSLIKSDHICRIKGCPFQDEKAFMFCFPENEHLRREWAELCDMSQSQGNTDRNCWVPRVCSYHFDKADLMLTPNGFRDLVANARPRLHLNGSGVEAGSDEAADEGSPPPPEPDQSDNDEEAFEEAKKAATKTKPKNSARKEMINQLLKESSSTARSHRAPRAAHGKHPRWDEVFDNVESAYEAIGGYTGYGTRAGALRGQRTTKNFAAQVDFPDGCNLLVYQCLKQLRNALAAKDEEIKHLRVLVHHLSSELKERKSTMVLATPVVFEDNFEEENMAEMEKYWFCDQTTKRAASADDSQATHTGDEGPQSTKYRKVETRGRPKKDAFLSLVSDQRGSIRTMCCVPGCPSPVTVAYHKFPSAHSPYYTVWMEKCLGSTMDGNTRDMSNATVCGQHFDDDCFDIEVTMNEENTETRTRTVLKEDAIPTLQLNEFVNL